MSTLEAKQYAVFEEGDIFRWRWKDEDKRVREAGGSWSTVYWCRSQTAVFRDGQLRDTYWSSPADGLLEPDRVNLTFLGNSNKMRKIFPGEKVFYRFEDVVDMSHANNSGATVYVKAGRDAGVMREYYEYTITRFESDRQSIDRRIAECREALEKVAAGEVDASLPVFCVG